MYPCNEKEIKENKI